MTEPNVSHPDSTRRVEREIVDELERVPGVLAAAAWLRDPQDLREAFITCAPGASVGAIRQAAADILARRGLHFSLDDLQVGLADEAAIPHALLRGRALVFDHVEVHRSDNRVTCRAHLTRRGRAASGEAHEIDTRLGRARAAARATLLAAEQATRSVRFGLEGVHILDLFDRRFVVVSVEAAFSRHVARLPGISVVTRSVEDAASLATLDALERWLAW